MSEENTPSNPPEPSIPKPSIPTPNLARKDSAPPVSAIEAGAMERPVPKQDPPSSEVSTPTVDSLLPKRLLGGMIDILVAVALVWTTSSILPDFLEKAASALGLIYLLTRDALPFLKGRSLGKMAAGLRAVTQDGNPLTNNWQASLTRNLVFIIPVLPVVEAIVLFTRENDPKKGLRLGDDFAKTKVIASQD